MPPFQTTVNRNLAFGVPGELYDSGPKRSRSYQLQSVDPTYNVFGRAFTANGDGIAQAGNASGTGFYLGILVNPKDAVSFGGSTGPLSPTLTLPNFAQAEILSEGSIIVSLPAAANQGDWVIYDNTTGALSTIAQGVALPGGKSYAYAIVEPYSIPGSGLAVITLTPYTAPKAL